MSRVYVIGAVSLVLLACDDEPQGPAQTADVDLGSGDIQADFNPDDSADEGGEEPDVSGPPLREVVERPLLDGTPVENRVFNPVLEPLFYGADWFAYTLDGQLVLAQRYVASDTPTALPALIYPGGDDVTAIGQVYLGRGPNEAGVWIGLPVGSEESWSAINVYLLGYDLTQQLTLVAVDLVRDRDSRREGADVIWYRWAGSSGALVGSAYLVVENFGDEPIWLHAPVIATATEKRAADPAVRAASPRDVANVARALALREERSSAWQRDRQAGQVRRAEPRIGRAAHDILAE